MGSAAKDILACEEPVAPAEAANVVESLEEENGCLGVFDGVFLHTDILGLFANVGQEFTLRTGAVGAELVENLGQRSFGHRNLAEVIQERDLDLLVRKQKLGFYCHLQCCHWHRSRHGS